MMLRSKVLLLLPLLILFAGGVAADESVELAPIPPIGASISQDSEGVIRIEMTESGTVVLGTGQIISREGNRPEMPGRYHIEFKAMGKVIPSTAGADVSLVVYMNRAPFKVHAAHGGKVLLPGTKEWSRMRVRYLAKSGGAGKVENVILGIYFKEPGIVELKELSCHAVALPSD